GRNCQPSLEEVAGEALVSRATAYRYFPTVDALLLEASLDVAVPQAGALFDAASPADALTRLERVDAALDAMILANEPALRTMLVQSVQRGRQREDADGLPVRQNRRTPLIEAALEPARKDFDPRSLPMLTRALALVIGTEAMVVCKDVLQLGDGEARKVRR